MAVPARAEFSATTTCRLALATLRRYPIAIALLTITVFAPMWRAEWRHLRVPPDRGAANALLNFEWAKLTFVWAITMLLASGLAPLVHATATRQCLSLRQRLNVVVGALLRGSGAVGLAIAAITLGLIAGVIPGLVLYFILWSIGPTTVQRPGSVFATFQVLGTSTHRRSYSLIALTFAPLVIDIALTAALHLGLLPNLSAALTPTAAHSIFVFTAINIVRTVVWASCAALLCAATGYQLTINNPPAPHTASPTLATAALPDEANAGDPD